MACPNCGSPQCVSNGFENVPFDQVAGGALAAKQAGRPAHAISVLLVWAGVEVVNHFRDGFRCLSCGHRFG